LGYVGESDGDCVIVLCIGLHVECSSVWWGGVLCVTGRHGDVWLVGEGGWVCDVRFGMGAIVCAY